MRKYKEYKASIQALGIANEEFDEELKYPISSALAISEIQKIQTILFWALFLGTEQHHTIRKHSNLI